jgi:hypothetical protein
MGDSLSAREAIRFMCDHAGAYHYWLHNVQTNSVVASESKTARGRAYIFCA